MNKEEFIVFKDYVDVLFNRNSDDGKHILGDFIHDTDFSKHDGDYILNFYINRIKKIFIKNAINIAVDILSPDDKFSLYTIMDRLKMKKENR